MRFLSDMFYRLDENYEPVLEPDVLEWERWWANSLVSGERQVVFTRVTQRVSVSTVFLGTNMAFGMDIAPILYETMVFGMADDEKAEINYAQRTYTAKLAREIHRDVVIAVCSELGIPLEDARDLDWQETLLAIEEADRE